MYCSNIHYWAKLGKLGEEVQEGNMLLAIWAISLAVS